MYPQISKQHRDVHTDHEGRYHFDQVPAGLLELVVTFDSKRTGGFGSTYEIEVLPGQTHNQSWVGNLATVAGQFVFPNDLKIDRSRSMITLDRRETSTESVPKAGRRRSLRESHHSSIPEDGRFEFRQLAPGTFDLKVHLVSTNQQSAMWTFDGPSITPEMFPATSAPPVIDLGEIRVTQEGK
jgi:hypothetical protein